MTKIERVILRRVAAGATNKAIAFETGLSEQTVKWHVSRMLRKYNVPNRAALAVVAASLDLESQEDD